MKKIKKEMQIPIVIANIVWVCAMLFIGDSPDNPLRICAVKVLMWVIMNYIFYDMSKVREKK